MATEKIAYSSSIGINNKVALHRLLFDPESGVGALEKADNILISQTGEAVSRRGIFPTETGEYHSLFSMGKWGLVIQDRTTDAAMFRVDVNELGTLSLGGIWSGLTKGAKMDFCYVEGAAFFTNGYGTGMVTSEAAVVAWVESAWPDDRSLVNFVQPPISDHLGYNSGRIYFSIGSTLHYTEYGHLGLYDPATDGENFETTILAIAPAVDGLYVSDSNAIYFLKGLDPKDWYKRQVTEYPALEWGKYNGVVDPSFFGFQDNTPSSLLATKEGPVICMPGGRVENLTYKNVTMPGCPDVGCIGLFDETLIIQTGEIL